MRNHREKGGIDTSMHVFSASDTSPAM